MASQISSLCWFYHANEDCGPWLDRKYSLFFIDDSLPRLRIPVLWHLLCVSAAADLPGFCICGLPWGQLQPSTCKKLRYLNGSGSSFPARLLWSRVLSDSCSSPVWFLWMVPVLPSDPLFLLPLWCFLAWWKISLQGCRGQSYSSPAAPTWDYSQWDKQGSELLQKSFNYCCPECKV